MDLELTDEQQHLRSVVGEALDEYAPLSLARGYLDGSGDVSELWSKFTELGWYEVGVSDGDGLGVPGLCVLAFELGRHAAPTLLVDSIVVARILDGAGDEGLRSRWLGPLVAGEAPIALAALDGAGSWETEHMETYAAARDGGAQELSGLKLGVHHADRAAALAVIGISGGHPAVFLVDPRAPGVSLQPERALDPSSGSRAAVLDGVLVEAHDAIRGPEAADAIRRGLLVGSIATAAEALGAASASLEMALTYAGERRQYGRTIGSFQAVQHLLADMHVLRETAWSTVMYAAAAVDERLVESEEAGRIAKAHASRAARSIGEGALQVLGGIGFTWEHDLHLLVRRALAGERRFGDALHHEARLGALLASRPSSPESLETEAVA